MHGEYKTPGGKLVVSDLTVRDGKLRDVVISGDFFLEPPEALSLIVESVENLSADSTEDEIADHIRNAVSGDVAMIGFSPEAVAKAIRRAVG
jgi:hypothetical protein